VAVTGGFYVRIGLVRVSSRDYRDALLVGVLATLAGLALTWWIDGREPFHRVWLRLKNSSSVGARMAATIATSGWSSASAAAAIVQWADAPPLWLDERTLVPASGTLQTRCLCAGW
jgi:hypothetical protein